MKRMTTTVLLAGSLAGLFFAANAAPLAQATKPAEDAAKKTATAKTVTVDFVSNIEMTIQGKKIVGTMKGTGQIDKVARASSMDIDMGSYMKAILESARGSAGMPPQFKDPANFRLRVIAIGEKVWMSYPLLNVLVPSAGTAPKPWILLDAKEMGLDPKQLASSQGADPTQGLDILRGLAGNATVVGKESVKGVATTHYRGVAELAALTKNLPAGQLDAIKKTFGGKASLPVDVWVDADGYARRMDTAIVSTIQGQSVSVKSEYYYSKFGEPTSIAPPPANQVGLAKDNPGLAAAIAQSSKKPA